MNINLKLKPITEFKKLCNTYSIQDWKNELKDFWFNGRCIVLNHVDGDTKDLAVALTKIRNTKTI